VTGPARRAAALYRQPSYSPNQHRTNDTAILDATVGGVEALGWSVTRASESAVLAGALPDADLVLNMCQGPDASQCLLLLETAGVPIINRPSSVLGCHRHRLVSVLATRAAVAFPRTTVVSTAGAAQLDGFGADGQTVWVKRGDVHAERAEDVVAVGRADLSAAIRAFGERGIARVALQEHVPGPVLKFYAVADGRFFRYYGAEAGPQGPVPRVDEEQLRTLAFAAAAELGLDVFGGDVALPEPDQPVLIDLNDWPSFAPFRDDAARHIAAYAHEYATTRHLQRIPT
jgi:glutathione synthase/RimK-type ligase-like ATP-grasp enzyme